MKIDLKEMMKINAELLINERIEYNKTKDELRQATLKNERQCNLITELEEKNERTEKKRQYLLKGVSTVGLLNKGQYTQICNLEDEVHNFELCIKALNDLVGKGRLKKGEPKTINIKRIRDTIKAYELEDVVL